MDANQGSSYTQLHAQGLDPSTGQHLQHPTHPLPPPNDLAHSHYIAHPGHYAQANPLYQHLHYQANQHDHEGQHIHFPYPSPSAAPSPGYPSHYGYPAYTQLTAQHQPNESFGQLNPHPSMTQHLPAAQHHPIAQFPPVAQHPPAVQHPHIAQPPPDMQPPLVDQPPVVLAQPGPTAQSDGSPAESVLGIGIDAGLVQDAPMFDALMKGTAVFPLVNPVLVGRARDREVERMNVWQNDGRTLYPLEPPADAELKKCDADFRTAQWVNPATEVQGLWDGMTVYHSFATRNHSFVILTINFLVRNPKHNGGFNWRDRDFMRTAKPDQRRHFAFWYGVRAKLCSLGSMYLLFLAAHRKMVQTERLQTQGEGFSRAQLPFASS
jgi:hypothetical protein